MHWLYRPGSVRRLWIGFAVVLAATVAAGFVVDMHPHFAFESLPAFFALFGFGACLVLVFGSKLLGVFLKRRDTYYDER
jgi:hypothetical protein